MEQGKTSPQKRLILALSVLVAVIAAIRIVSTLSTIAFLNNYSVDITVLLLMLPPLILNFFGRDSLSYINMSRVVLMESLRWFVIAAAVIFPVAFFINHFYQQIFFNVNYHNVATESSLLTYSITQFFAVALPEEFFFRGFILESFDRVFVPRFKFFGVLFGTSDVITAILFALAHSLILWQWWHAFIFFPALVFSWLKRRTGAIWAGALFHWACNLFAYWVYLHY